MHSRDGGAGGSGCVEHLRVGEKEPIPMAFTAWTLILQTDKRIKLNLTNARHINNHFHSLPIQGVGTKAIYMKSGFDAGSG